MPPRWRFRLQIFQVAVVRYHREASVFIHGHPGTASAVRLHGFQIAATHNLRMIIPEFRRRSFAGIKLIAIGGDNESIIGMLMKRKKNETHADKTKQSFWFTLPNSCCSEQTADLKITGPVQKQFIPGIRTITYIAKRFKTKSFPHPNPVYPSKTSYRLSG